MQFWQITSVYHPTPCTFFTYTYAPLPTLCTKPLMTLLLPYFHMENEQNSSVTAQLSASPQNLCTTSFRSLPCITTQNIFQHHPTPHIFGPCIHHGKFVVALQPQFHFFYASLLALLQIPDRHASLLHPFSLSFLVYCCFFCFQLFSFLTGFH